MDVSRFLSKVLGLYLIFISLAIFINMKQVLIPVTRLVSDSPLMMVTGFFTLILGLLLVVSHNVWQWNWRVLVTIISWVILLKALCIIFCPHFMDKMTDTFIMHANIVYMTAGIDMFLGLLLCYFGFRQAK